MSLLLLFNQAAPAATAPPPLFRPAIRHLIVR
jgi:hypothetical protein